MSHLGFQFNLPDHLGRDADGQDAVRDGFGHHRPGANDAPATDVTARVHGSAGANKGTLADRCPPGQHSARADMRVRADLNVMAYGAICTEDHIVADHSAQTDDHARTHSHTASQGDLRSQNRGGMHCVDETLAAARQIIKDARPDAIFADSDDRRIMLDRAPVADCAQHGRPQEVAAHQAGVVIQEASQLQRLPLSNVLQQVTSHHLRVVASANYQNPRGLDGSLLADKPTLRQLDRSSHRVDGSRPVART